MRVHRDLSCLRPDLHWQNSRAREYVENLGGSKSGAYFYLNDTCPHLRKHLPPGTSLLVPGEDVDKFVKKLDVTNPKIVRCCHYLDFIGMVDVLPTIVNVVGRKAIRQAIDNVLTKANSPEVKSFVEYEFEEKFNGDVIILVQDFCGYSRGSVVEHPHERGVFRIGRIVPTQTSSGDLTEEVFHANGRALDIRDVRLTYDGTPHYKTNQHIPIAEAEAEIALYKEIQDSGLIPSTHSYQMEYGIEQGTGNVLFYQARLFKKFEPRADFKVETDPTCRSIETLPYNTYGITSRSGTEMHMAELDNEFIHEYDGEETVAYGYDAFEHRNTTALDVQPRNLHTYLPYQFQILEHGHYRWLQKAQVSLVGVRGALTKRTEPLNEPGSMNVKPKIRVCSNGINASASLIE